MSVEHSNTKPLRPTTETKVGVVVLLVLFLIVSVSLFIKINRVRVFVSHEPADHLDFRDNYTEPRPLPQFATLNNDSAQPLNSAAKISTELQQATTQLATFTSEIPKTHPSRTAATFKTDQTLFEIAKDQLGSGDRWIEIYQLNKSSLDSNRAALHSLQLPKSAATQNLIECAVNNHRLISSRSQ